MKKSRKVVIQLKKISKRIKKGKIEGNWKKMDQIKEIFSSIRVSPI
jgi:hypothetical protein